MPDTRPKRLPPGPRRELRIKVPPEVVERIEAYCLRQAAQPPFHDLKPTVVARRGILFYLEQLEAEEALLPTKRGRPACVYAVGAGGMAWCPEHDARWIVGTAVPECCRGDG